MGNQVIDIEDGLGRVMGNKKIYLRLIGKFSGRKMADDIIESIHSKDFDKITQSAHALKGVAANLGFTVLNEITKQIEARAKNEETVDDLIPELNNAVEETLTAIDSLMQNELASEA